MGANNSQALDEDLRQNIERYSKGVPTEFNRLQYHGVRYPKGKPPPPEGTPSVRDITHNSVTVTWSPPKNYPISCILAYQVEVFNIRERTWKTVTKSCQGTSYDVKSLSPETEYRFRVKVESVYGWSKPSQSTVNIRTRSERNWLRKRSDRVRDGSSTLVRRHSHYLKVETSVSALLSKTETEENSSSIGAIPFKRNSSIRLSLPCPRRPIASVLPGSRRESVCSLKESQKSMDDSSVFSDDTDEISSLKLHRISTSTEEESCNRSSSGASMTSIPEEGDFGDCKLFKEDNLKSPNEFKPHPTPESLDVLSGSYSDEIKLAWFSKSLNQRSLDETDHIDCSPVWKGRCNNNNNQSDKNFSDLRSLRSVLNSNDVMVKKLNSDNNGNYTFNPQKKLLHDNVITEVDEDNIAFDIVSTL